MAVKKKAEVETEISVLEIEQGEMHFCVLGTSPMFFNRVAEKAKRELLLPKGGRKTKAERAESLKHNPLEEYRNSVYRRTGDNWPTRLCFPAPAFKDAMGTAALDLPGTKKSEIGRLTYIVGTHVDIYGIPMMHMGVVRTADAARTPDIRTRAILPEWACRVRVRFVKPRLHQQAVANLLAAAGVTCGIGDFRQQKGKGSYGQFALVSETDKDFVRIVRDGGIMAQDAALESPDFCDPDTEELYGWFKGELARRFGKGAA